MSDLGQWGSRLGHRVRVACRTLVGARPGDDQRRMKMAVEEARAIEATFRLDAAAARWAEVRAEFSGFSLPVMGLGSSLRRLNRLDEAEAVLAEGASRFPNDKGVAIERILLAQQCGDFALALERSRSLQARFPNEPYGFEGTGRALRDMHRFDEADAEFVRGRERFPLHLGLATEHACTADLRGDWPEGLRRWRAIGDSFADAAIIQAGIGAALRRLRRFDEADAVLEAAMTRFPGDDNLGVNHAWVADERGDAAEALRRWSALRAAFPHHERIRTGWLESQARTALAAVDRLIEAAEPPPPAPSEPATTAGDQHKAMFMQFESLGENCEFGFVQRHFGAEPLGLLRWAGIDFDKLLAGLEADFDGVGGPARTVLNLNPSNHEYYTVDTFYGLGMHTFISRDDGNEPKIYQKMCRRLDYLRGKLLDDLRSAEKIFVFQSGRALDEADILRLHAGLARHGPNRLLVVRPEAHGGRAGEVRLLAENVAEGIIDRVGFDGKRWAVSFDHWLRICQAAAALLLPGPPSQA